MIITANLAQMMVVFLVVVLYRNWYDDAELLRIIPFHCDGRNETTIAKCDKPKLKKKKFVIVMEWQNKPFRMQELTC